MIYFLNSVFLHFVILNFTVSTWFLSTTFANPNHEVEVVFEAPNSRCHAEGRAYQCMPPFTNIAEGIAPQVSSQCGQKQSEFICSSTTDGRENCIQCQAESSSAAKMVSIFPARHLTDKHITGNETCWMSAALEPDSPAVNITLSFGKQFEVYYISLQPCSDLPHSIAIYKSSDQRRTWKPWQYFSHDCQGTFNVPTSNDQDPRISAENVQQVLCVALKPIPVRGAKKMYNEAVIAFSTTFGRPSMQPWSAALIDWMTVTDINIVLFAPPERRRFPLNERNFLFDIPGFNVASHSAPRSSISSSSTENPNELFLNSRIERGKSFRSSGNGRNKLHFGFSDVAVGGRCKCNGHANRCVRNKNTGQLVCDCQHNTAGLDCERCEEGHVDQPWQRASIVAANVCKRCECHLHSEKCTFSEELYAMSGRTSGGVCEDCQHNTAGRQCHYCADGFYRDWTLPLSHENVCVKCRCHPIGAANTRLCDKKTGQCLCKEGVTGQFCDRCQDGYKQTRSTRQPCDPDFGRSRLALIQDKNCKHCRGNQKRIRFKKFCRKHLVFQATVLSSQRFGEYMRYEIQMHFVWRRASVAWFTVPLHSNIGVNGGSSSASIQPVWVKMEDMLCRCPDLQTGATYLIITNVKYYYNKGYNELVLTHASLALPWQDAWQRRLLKFKKSEMRGECEKFAQKPRIAEKEGANVNANFALGPTETRKSYRYDYEDIYTPYNLYASRPLE